MRFIEDVDSREIETERGPDGEQRMTGLTLHYTLEGTSDEGTARTLAETSSPDSYTDPVTDVVLVRKGIRCEPEWVDSVNATGLWNIEVTFGLEDEAEPETGESSFSFDTGGGTTHITQGLDTKLSRGIGAAKAPDFKSGIGVTPDGVQGVDITTPIYNWSETHYLPDATVTEEYRGRLFRLTGRTNKAIFKGCAIGECLFLGSSGSKRSDEDWEVTFRFAASPNRTSSESDWPPPALTKAGFAAFDKKGWEYLWIHYHQKEQTNPAPPPAKWMVWVPDALYVEQVYHEGDFSELEIGA